MNTDSAVAADLRRLDRVAPPPGTGMLHTSGVSWAAIFAGAAGAAALSLILLVLGVGLGLSSVSAWSNQGVAAATFGISTILWLTFTQVAASGMGGYLAGRLRTKWAGVHTDEVYFRDTAHGFLAWSLATLVTASFLGSAVTSVLSGGVQAGAAVAGGATTTLAAGVTAVGAAAGKGDAGGAGASDGGMGYFVDTLFRRDPAAAGTAAPSPTGATDNGASTAEVARIFANDIRAGALSPEDARYVGQAIAQRTGLSQADAEKRAVDTMAKVQAQLRNAEAAARDAADKARKASSYAALWLFVSLLAGAFIASLCATYGGRRRDL